MSPVSLTPAQAAAALGAITNERARLEREAAALEGRTDTGAITRQATYRTLTRLQCEAAAAIREAAKGGDE